MTRAVVLGATIYGCCVDSHGVRGCGIEDCCDGRVHVKNVIYGIFRWIKRMIL